MKKFIFRSVLILVIFYSCYYSIYFSLPFYWANEGFSTKMEYLKKQEKNINTVFIGSSRTQMHIMPSVFDSLTQACDVKSYNLGFGSNSAEEIIHFTEKLLQGKHSKDLKYIFVEVRPVWYNPENLFTTRGKYILDKTEYSFLTNYYSKTKYTHAVSDYRKAFIEKTLGIGVIRDVFSYYFNKDKSFLLGENNDGFVNRREAISKDKLNKLLEEQGNDVEKTRKELQKRFQFATDSYNTLQSVSDEDSLYVDRLKKLVSLANDKGIELYYYPTIRFENTNVPAILNAVDKNGLFLQTSNPKLYPELYSINYSGDVSHLSLKGAGIYTTILADLFNQKACQ